MVLAEHWVAHTRGGRADVLEPASARWLWTHLRERFPLALGCTLMPDHLHLAPPDTNDPDPLRRILQHHARRFGIRWDLRAEPERANTPRILARMARYLVQNAPRDGLVADPFEWPWCTLRDLVGAVADPWTPLSRLTATTRMRPDALLRYLVGPEHPPLSESERPIAAPLEAIAEAAAAATRTTPSDITRRGLTRAVFLGLGADLGGCNLNELAAACGITRRAAYELRRSVSPQSVAAARRCLADTRLRRWNAPVPGPRMRSIA